MLCLLVWSCLHLVCYECEGNELVCLAMSLVPSVTTDGTTVVVTIFIVVRARSGGNLLSFSINLIEVLPDWLTW